MTEPSAGVRESEKPQVGTWTLIRPDGRQFTGDSPLKVLRAEINTRVSVEVKLERIMAISLEEEDAQSARIRELEVIEKRYGWLQDQMLIPYSPVRCYAVEETEIGRDLYRLSAANHLDDLIDLHLLRAAALSEPEGQKVS